MQGTVNGQGERATKIGLLAVVMLGIVKGLLGFYLNSVALKAQAFDAATDILALLAVYVGLRLADKKPTERFPYGYYRVETLVSVVISGLILFTGYEILHESIHQIRLPTQVSQPQVALAVALGSLPVPIMLSLYFKRTGEALNSHSLTSQAGEFRSDIYSAVVVILGLAGNYLGYLWVEGVAGAIISAIILRMGAVFGWQGLLALLDAVVNPEQLEDIERIALAVEGVDSVKHIRVRRAGPYSFGELTICVEERLPVELAHGIATVIEERIKAEHPYIESIVIHVEPHEETNPKLAFPVSVDHGLESPLSDSFGESPFFIVLDLVDSEVTGWRTVVNTMKELDAKRGLEVSRLLLEEGVTVLVSTQIGEGAVNLLQNRFVHVYSVSTGATVREALNLYIGEELKKL